LYSQRFSTHRFANTASRHELRVRQNFLALCVAVGQAGCNLCQRFPNYRFFVTMLARENQHELTVAARKFGNLMPFGCWWFLNNPRSSPK